MTLHQLYLWTIRVSVVLLVVSSAFAQPATPRSFSAQDRAAIVDSAARILTEKYVFPDMAKKMAAYIQTQRRNGVYDSAADPYEFVSRLTEDLRSISHDGHLGLMVSSASVMTGSPDDSVFTEEEQRKARERERCSNYGFVKVEHLSGNVGYIKLNEFADAEIGGATAIAAMNFVGNCDALIFDLRENGGGEPSMIQLITSYLFSVPKHLNSFMMRDTTRVEQFWSLAYVPGRRLPDTPVYVLTSRGTFSGAEEFSYNLKNMKRGKIVGEVTGGGAHPTELFLLKDFDIVFSVPYGRAVNPITGTNWEGVGVKPDMECPASEAFDIAYLDALKMLRTRIGDSTRIYEIEWSIQGLEDRTHPITLGPNEMSAYVGSYGPRTISLENGALFYQRENRPKRKLLPMGKHLFGLEGMDDFRAEFVADAKGKIVEIVGRYKSGFMDRHPRTK